MESNRWWKIPINTWLEPLLLIWNSTSKNWNLFIQTSDFENKSVKQDILKKRKRARKAVWIIFSLGLIARQKDTFICVLTPAPTNISTRDLLLWKVGHLNVKLMSRWAISMCSGAAAANNLVSLVDWGCYQLLGMGSMY